jgi:septum site-determining protein MinC
MSVALAGRAPATFEIKSANLPLVALLLKSHDLAALADELKQRFGDIPDFFDDDPMVIDLSPLAGVGEIDFEELTHLLRGYRVMPVAVKGGSDEQMKAAALKGLAAANELRVIPTPTTPGPVAVPARSDKPAPVAMNALVIDKPLRSGQQVYARGRDLVVMSMVNAGAEVIADGHIHVYAPLRGKAIAGAKGNTDARIFALSLEAELLSIAGVYRTSEIALPADIHGRPAQVKLVGGAEGKLVMEPIQGN